MSEAPVENTSTEAPPFPARFRLGGVVWSLIWLAVLAPALPDVLVGVMHGSELSPEASGTLVARLLGGLVTRFFVWVSLVHLASVLLWRIAGRKRWAGYLGSALMLVFLSCASAALR